jgi:MFS family permease
MTKRAETIAAAESASAPIKAVAFAALRHRDFRVFFPTTMLAMMADNIEHVISYWLLYEKFQSPVLAGFAVISHWTPFLLLSVYFGGLADRYDCRKLIQIAQVMYMAVSVAGQFSFLQILSRFGTPACCSSFTVSPAYSGHLPSNC